MPKLCVLFVMELNVGDVADISTSENANVRVLLLDVWGDTDFCAVLADGSVVHLSAEPDWCFTKVGSIDGVAAGLLDWGTRAADLK